MILEHDGRGFEQTGDYRAPRKGEYYLSSTALPQLRSPISHRKIVRALTDWGGGDEPRIILRQLPWRYYIEYVTEAELVWLRQHYRDHAARSLVAKAKAVK